MVQKYFHDMVEAGCDAVVMEVSSQGLMLHRTQGFVFDFGIFTNIEPDHIGPNEHKDFDDYLHCKSMLLRQCKVGIVNRDDEHFDRIIEGHTCKLETYGFPKKQISVQRTPDSLEERAIWEFPIMLRDLWIFLWRLIFQVSSAFTIL